MKMSKIQDNKQISEEALKLLPWYATGWLSPKEREYMQDALSEFPDLQSVLDSEHEILKAIKDDKSILDRSCLKPTDYRLNELLKKLPEQSSKKDVVIKPQQGFIQSILNVFLGLSSKTQYAAFASVGALSIALLFTFAVPVAQEGNTFYPATSKPETSKNTGTTILVGLSAGLDDPRLLKVLKENNAAIDAVPGKNGMYRLKLSDKLSAEGTKKLLNALTTDDKDLFWFAGEEF